MPQANLKVLKNEADQASSAAPIEVDTAMSDEWLRPGPIPFGKGQRLDVDAILARSSLPKSLRETASETKSSSELE